jgi:hypothetical protein
MDEVAEFFRILDEKYGCVVANKVPVTVFGIEFYGKPAGISLRIR